MKNKHYLLLLVAVALASCSAENITENVNPAQNTLTLNKVETYFPSKDFYDNSTATIPSGKTVQYFENGFIVADSTFNFHSLESVTVRSATATSASEITYDRDNIAQFTALYTYDALGRITELSVTSSTENYRKTMVYSENGDAVVTNHDPIHGSEYRGTYIANEDGIFSQINATNENESLAFSGGKPVTYLQSILDSNTILNMEYYNVTVPANRLKTTTQINNITLVGNLYNSVAENCGFYLKGIVGIYNYDHTFNDLNYITHSMRYDLVNPGTTETFYYYNE